jgi:DNA-binding response OmpR family regulator
VALNLVVEDEYNVRIPIERILRHAGHEVSQTESGKKAIQLCHEKRFDLVITDLAMPDMDGLELIRSLRRSSSNLPVLAISGAFDGQFLKAAALMGAVGALHKPFTQGELLAIVNKNLQKEPR